MQRIRRRDGTFLTDEEISKIQNVLTNAGKPISRYLRFSELEGGILLPIQILGGAYIEIVNAEIKENEIVFDLKLGDFIFEREAIYPLSKGLDKKNEKRISTSRLMAFLDWQILKNVDKIEEYQKK